MRDAARLGEDSKAIRGRQKVATLQPRWDPGDSNGAAIDLAGPEPNKVPDGALNFCLLVQRDHAQGPQTDFQLGEFERES